MDNGPDQKAQNPFENKNSNQSSPEPTENAQSGQNDYGFGGAQSQYTNPANSPTSAPSNSYGNANSSNYDTSTNSTKLSEPLYGASFGQAIKRFFKKYARFSGYASRSEYWYVTLFLFLLSIIPTIVLIAGIATAETTVDAYGQMESEAGTGSTILTFLALLMFLVLWVATIVPSFALTWRRFHDAGYSGAFYFLSFIPSIGGLIVLIFMVLPSKPEARRIEWNDNRND